MDLAIKETTVNYRRGSKYNEEDRRYCAVLFCLYGNVQKVAELTGIPRPTIACWLNAPWWNDLINVVQQENKHELNGTYNRLLKKTSEVIEKQLEDQQVKALDAAKIHGIMFDKRQILNNQPTSITKTTKINDLAEEFERFVAAKEIKIDKE